MWQAINRSVRRKLMLVVLVTTFTALLVTAIALVVYNLRTYQQSSIEDLVTQADILARASAPALVFDDPEAARANLALLKVKPKILAGAIYTPRGALFATYAQNDDLNSQFPSRPADSGYQIEGNQLAIFHTIVENKEVLGTVYLRARYELVERLADHLSILGAVMVGSFLVAVLMSVWLQRAVTKPILDVATAARNVMQQRDFSPRVLKTTDDEIGVLVDAFNDMLAEVGRRAEALEASNLTLQHEMHERRGAEQALLLADRRKNEFLAMLAHELRNPLAPLRTALHILSMAGDDAGMAKSARDMMERQLQQMVRLVDDLLDVSRITTGKLTIRKDRIELRTVIRSAVEPIRSFIEARSHALTVDLPQEPLYLDADVTRLAQVFSNLLNNAAKYTEPGGSISLSARLDGDDVVVTVADSGIGLESDMLSAIFEMFTQVDYSLERSQAGLGVGLTLAKRLIELHGGTIEARSDGLRRGSQFVVRLPVRLRGAAKTGAAESLLKVDGDVSGHRVLLADDNVDFVTSLGYLLKAMGNEVKITHDGSAALEAAADFRPDFAFLDIGMPKLNGYDLAMRLRELPSTSGSVLVAVTGWGQEKDRQLAQEAGFDYHMVKPVGLDQIETILRSARPPGRPRARDPAPPV